MSKDDVRSPVNLKLESLTDLARMLLGSSAQRDRMPSMLYFEHEGKHVFGTMISHHGYYELYGLPLWIYTVTDEAPAGNFLSYSSREKEEIEFVNVPQSEPLKFYLAIIRLADKIEILDI
ncbi:MAG: hypothetical protein EAX81_01090 [Candidatus Thorarchaeota archaeon]|nr:hypothetical protein [Candidatus Thorarchaeota archaeon]